MGEWNRKWCFHGIREELDYHSCPQCQEIARSLDMPTDNGQTYIFEKDPRKKVEYNMDNPPPREGVEFETMEEMAATRDILIVGHADNGLASIRAAIEAVSTKPKCILVNPTPYTIEYRPPVNLFKNHMKRWMKGR